MSDNTPPAFQDKKQFFTRYAVCRAISTHKEYFRKPRLERIEADVLANFKMPGVRARFLNGYERLSVLHRMFHPADNQKFRFAWP